RPLQLMLVKSSGTTGFTRTAVVMTGAIHGNEYLNIEDRLPEELIARARSGSGSVASFLSAGGVLVFVPIVNPDGYESRSRYNAKGVDLNRDWDVPSVGHTGFKQVESAALSNALE